MAQFQHHFVDFFLSVDSIMPPDDFDRSGATQAELNTNDYPKKIDSLLNYLYNSILEDYKWNKPFIKYFKNSQKVWLTYRKAMLEAILPPTTEENRGSITPLCYSEYLVAINKRRIEELLLWHNGTEYYGDSCGTSYLSKDELDDMRKKNKKRK